jgi:hypothetical protein
MSPSARDRRCSTSGPGTSGGDGCSEHESATKLGILFAHLLPPKYVHEHHRIKGDLMMWDSIHPVSGAA